MKRFFRYLYLVIIILVISIFPVFMSPTRSIWDSDKEDQKKISEQIKGVEKVNPD